MKIDKTVKKETIYITGSVLILSVVMELIFAIIGKWNLSVLYGNLLGGLFAILNFFLMGLTVQKAVGQDEKKSANLVKMSQSLRFLLLIIVAILGVELSVFNGVSTIVSLFFPRIAIAIRPLFDKKKQSNKSSSSVKGSEDI